MNDITRRFLKISQTVEQSGMRELEQYTLSTDFFEAPASSKYHGSHKGGLVEHSLLVYEILYDLCSLYEPSISKNSIIKVSLYHDICKANFYKIEMKNVKENGQWIQKPQYVIDDKFPLGHGEKSCFIIQKFVDLTEEEALAIRWHMGAYDEAVKGGTYSFVNAQNKYKLVTLLHVADMIASKVLKDEKLQGDSL